MIPNKIQIGPHQIRVEVTNNPPLDLVGHIFIKKDLPLSMQWETLIYEIIATIRKMTGIELEDQKQEEKIVQVQALLLFQILKDNPKLLEELVALNEIQIF